MTVETRADCEEEPLSAMLAGFVFVFVACDRTWVNAAGVETDLHANGRTHGQVR